MAILTYTHTSCDLPDHRQFLVGCRDLYKGLALGATLQMAACFFLGFLGFLAAWSGAWTAANTTDSGVFAVFEIFRLRDGTFH